METTKDYTQEGIVNIFPIQNLEVTLGNVSLSETFSLFVFFLFFVGGKCVHFALGESTTPHELGRELV